MPLIVKDVLVTVLTAFLLLMFIRFIVDLVMAFSRDWRPSGILIVIFEVTYTITDPPLKALRRIIPTLRLGNFALDLSFLILFIAVGALRQTVINS
ncbi:MAG: YggT family protein [Frankiaceae bacterium]|jgi:YggT family protein|nr:YggT family protein [Frankiaceae bacterium]